MLGEIDKQEEDTTKAIDDFKEVLNISEKLGSNCHKITTIQSLSYLSDMYQYFGENLKQLDCLEQALVYARKNKLTTDLISIYNNLVAYYLCFEDLEQAELFFNALNKTHASARERNNEDQYQLVT